MFPGEVSSGFSDFVVDATAVGVGIFCLLSADLDEKTPLPVEKRSLRRCKVAPASRGNWGRETGTVALTIESQPNLAALSVPQYEVHHTAASSDQQNDERDQCKAADEHHPVP